MGRADAAVVGERLGAPERVGDPGGDEGLLDRDDLFVEKHGLRRGGRAGAETREGLVVQRTRGTARADDATRSAQQAAECLAARGIRSADPLRRVDQVLGNGRLLHGRERSFQKADETRIDGVPGADLRQQLSRGRVGTLGTHGDAAPARHPRQEGVSATGVTGAQLNQLTPIVAKLIDIFLAYDLTLVEINPLVRLEDGRFLVVDGHVDMEAEARDQHKKLLDELGIQPEETRQARPPTDFEIRGAEVDRSDHRGVAGNVVEFDGDLGLVIGAGGGSLTLFDAVRENGGKPANYCEIGGNPSVKKACGLTKLVLSKPGVEKIAVMMNVVSNTRVDIVARGVIKGCIESGRDPADAIAIFRIPGAWEEEGFKILDKYGVDYCDRSVSMFDAAARAVEKMK